MQSYLAAALQLQSGPELEPNLAQAAEQIERAAREGARLIGLPENFPVIGNDAEKVARAEEIARACMEFLSTQAARHGVTLLGGGFPVPAPDGRVYNTAVLMSPEGRELARYRKIHLFDVKLPEGYSYRESETVMPGTDGTTIHASEELGVLGLSICYDLRFPELYRQLAREGAEVLMIPAAFTALTGRDHWETLVRARAIENTCYAVAPAQTGHHYKRRRSHGHAMIVDPWGKILADAGEAPGLALARIEPERLAEVRGQIPSLKHRVLMQ